MNQPRACPELPGTRRREAPAPTPRFELLSPGRYLPQDYWSTLSPGCRRVEVELGPGDGRFLIESARDHPDTLFVGLEIRAGYVASIGDVASLPPNVRIFHFDAGFIVRHILATASVDAFHLYFPDPWWKKRHHKRRLVTPEVATALRRCLMPGASVYVITDVASLFADIAEHLLDAGLAISDWTRDAASPAQSSYERKYRRQGRRLEQGRFTKEIE